MSETSPIRVLVVDDSAFTRKVVREVLERAPGIQVVGIARDGLDALEQCAVLKPDVITLDLVMPELDGLGVLRAFTEGPWSPRVVLVSTSASDSELAVEALQLGAVDLVEKPTTMATDRLYELGEELVAKVRVAARSGRAIPEVTAVAPLRFERSQPTQTKIIVVGTSTGGPQALTRLLASLPSDLPVPVAIVLHIPLGYTRTLAERLNRASALTVLEAEHGLEFGPGTAVIAQAGIHLRVVRAGDSFARCMLDPEPLDALHRPSVDTLFSSAALAFSTGVLGVILTGMGDDGLIGSQAIRSAKGRIITEHASSCIVDGMPRAVKEAGLSNAEASLDAMAETILSQV